jgi:6-phosphogluconolactonase (cycloisomerase 2 family)
MQRYVLSVVACGAVWLGACADQTTQPRITARPITTTADKGVDDGQHAVGGVYTSTNGASGNAVIAFARFENGALAKVGEFPTGGSGIGGGVDPLESQGALVVSPDHQRLFVVNAGSNSISTFAVSADASLRLLGTVASGGSSPISLTLANGRLYVLNGDNSISGFAAEGDALPQPISHLSLGAASDGPSTIGASRDGKFLFVTERVAGAVDVISVGAGGELTVSSRRASSGNGPFGFAVTSRDQLIVSEAAGSAPNGAVSSYTVTTDGALSTVSASLSTHQAATCWLVLTRDGRFAFAANAGSGSISGYDVSPDGSLTALNADGRTGVTNGSGATPLDMDASQDGRFLFVLQTGAGTIGAFAIGNDGRLNVLPDTPGLSAAAGFQGLAAF